MKTLPSNRRLKAFTLIEMLVVIAIIALLSGLVVGLAPIAKAKMRRSRVEGDREALITYIDTYKKVKGFYPPDNKVDSVRSPLFYELTGTVLTNGNFVSITHEIIPSATVIANFGMEGFINTSVDSSEVRNFAGNSLKTSQYGAAYLGAVPGPTFMVLGAEVPGPVELKMADHPYFNPWHYVSSNPTNNPDSYDLWMDVLYSGKTNRISNWSKDPQSLLQP